MTVVPQPPPNPSPVPGRNPAAVSSIADRRVLMVVTGLLVSLTVLQRFALPLGPVLLSVSVPVALLGLAYLLYHGDAIENSAATRAFVLATAVCCLAAAAALLLDGAGSLTSLVYLLVIWAVFCVRLHPARRHLFGRVLDRFEKLMVAFAVVGILQTAAQAVGAWTYVDYVLQVVPEQFLFVGYNTSYPIQYGSPIIKANGFFFVEPSVYAQFLAMALLSTLVRRARALRTVLLGAALVLTISGTGLLFVAFGIAVLAVRRGGLWVARIAAGVAVLGGIALATPFGAIILSRTTETSESNSSGSLRFVQPYQRILDAWGDDPLAVLIGTGPGYADDLADQIFAATALPINFSGLAKLVFEYGVPAALLFCVFVALALVRRAPSPTLALSGLFANAVLTGSLLQPQVLYLMVVTSSLFLGHSYEADRDAERRAESGRAAEEEEPDGLSDTAVGPAAVPVTVRPADPNGRGEA